MTALAIYVGLLLARLGAFVAVMPFVGTRAPRAVKAGFVIVLAAFYISAAPPPLPNGPVPGVEIESVRYAVALLREMVIGAGMGFAFGLFLLPARVAGEFVTVQVGLNVAPLPGPTGTDSAGAITTLFETMAAFVFLVADGHHVVLSLLHASFSAYPLGGAAVPEAAPMVAGLSTAYEMGLLIAAPLGVCMFLLSVTLAIMSRAAPQLNIYSVGFTLQVAVVLFGGLFLTPELVRTLTAIAARLGVMLPDLT
jgi:flagellar biosynthetic protein FliR